MKKVKDCWDYSYYRNCTIRFLSDLHLDSPYTDLKKLKKLFDDAQKNQYKIVIIGDLLDVMGGKYDRRTTKGDIKPEHNTDNYINSVCESAADFLAPYIRIMRDILGYMAKEGTHKILALLLFSTIMEKTEMLQ